MEKLYHLYFVRYVTKVVYVGSTGNPKHRWRQHCTPSNKAPLSVAIQKYGKSSFEMELIASGSKTEIKRLEEHFTEEHNTVVPHGFNRKIGDRLTSEHKAKMSRLGTAMTTEAKDKIRLTKTGKNVGELNTQAKLDRQAVDQIRAMFAEGHNNRTLSELFKVSTATIRDIVKYRSWK